MRYLITVSYDGTLFAGYQKQPKQRTVQGEIEKALKEISGGKKIDIHASGRTDAGVHSFGQVANFNYISSLNFRISREIKGCSNCMINELIKNNNSIYNTLLISPPGMRQDDIVA